MNERVRSESVDGGGECIRLANPVKGTIILGEVLRWTLGDPQVRVYTTGEVRYYPASWIQEVAE